MKLSKDEVQSIGLTVLYEPDDPQGAVVDVVFVHGLGGHPVRTWLHSSPVQIKSPKRSGPLGSLLRKGSTLKKSNPNLVQAAQDKTKNTEGDGLTLTRSASILTLGGNDSLQRKGSTKKFTLKRSNSRLRLELKEEPKQTGPEVYWPVDLLPESCPNVRILTWGFLALTTNGKLLPAQDDLFAHARELFQELVSFRDETLSANRPLAFIAHSTGGIIVKEVLRLAESEELSSKDLLLSTSGVIFLGSPHRASEYGKLSDAIKNMASVSLGISSVDETLHDLSGADRFEVELGKESFLRQWNNHNFTVKTYHEHRLVPSLRPPDVRANLFLRREASFLGEHRERPEALPSCHTDICKFASAEEAGYKSIISFMLAIVDDEHSRSRQLSKKERACLSALSRSRKPALSRHSAISYPGTCLWLYEIPEFRAWHHRSAGGRNKILWIKGRPGSGKSVLLRSLRNRIEKQWSPSGSAFVWSKAEGQSIDTVFFPGADAPQNTAAPAGVYRELLCQLYKYDPRLRKAMVTLYKRSRRSSSSSSKLHSFDDAQVVSFFMDEYIDSRIETPFKRTFIFIDASDSCGLQYLKDLLYCLGQLAYNSDFSICVATAHYTILDSVVDNAVEITTHERNMNDILRYISLHLLAEWEHRNQTVARIAEKAGGVFLWAEIVVNMLNLAIEEGASEELIEETIAELPSDLEGLYGWMLGTLADDERSEALVLMQWAVLASEAPRLNDLRIAVRLTRTWSMQLFRPYMALDTGPATSIRDLRKPSDGIYAFDTPYQFHRWVKHRSIGLLQVRSEPNRNSNSNKTTHEPLGLQRVEVVHESVRTFFLTGRGFAYLMPHAPKTASTEDLIDQGHYSLLHACLMYLNMTDFEAIGRGNLAVAPMPYEENKYWKKNVNDQRNLVKSSYPFLQYAVDNLLFHLLSPRFFRYFLPQHAILRVLSENRCRLWRRWTALLGESDPEAILASASSSRGRAQELLDPVFGARYRLLRVLRRVRKIAAGQNYAVATPKTPRSAGGSEKTLLSPPSLADGFKMQWFNYNPLAIKTSSAAALAPVSPASEKMHLSPLFANEREVTTNDVSKVQYAY